MIEHISNTSIHLIQHSIGQVLCSRCHLYLFSFSEAQTSLCRLTCGATAHLLGNAVQIAARKVFFMRARRVILTGARSLGTGWTHYFSFLKRFYI